MKNYAQVKKKYSYLVYLFLIILVAFRTYNLSITHDESDTFFDYTQKPFGQYFSNMQLWLSANNHLLNTYLMNFFIRFLGTEPWALRLPNCLSFLIYLYFTYRLSVQNATSKYSFWAITILLLFNAFLLDFFSLARGYGLCAAFALAFIYYVQQIILQPTKIKNYFGFSFAAIFMCYACFIGLSLFVSGMALVVFYIAYQYFFQKQTSNILLPIIVFFITSFIVFYPLLPILHHLSTIGEFQWGESNFIKFVLKIFYVYTNKITRIPYAIFLFSLLFFSIILLLKNSKKLNSTFIFQLFFWALLGCVVASFLLAHTRFPDTRKAILFYPIIALCTVEIIEKISFKNVQQKSTLYIAIIAFIVLQFFISLQINTTREWNYDNQGKYMYAYLNSKHTANTPALHIACNWYFQPSFFYYQQTKYQQTIVAPIYSKTIITDTAYQYYICMPTDTALLSKTYVVDTIFDDSKIIMKQK